jgi:FlaA1/EpsC-like NDP-sugar epimerase
MKRQLRNPKFYLMILGDAAFVAAAFIASFFLRYDGQIPEWQWGYIEKALPLVVGVKLVMFLFFRLYRGMWRYTGLVDLLNVLKAGLLSSVILVLIILFFFRFVGYPRTVFVLDLILTLVLVGGIRIAIRIFMSEHLSSSWIRRPLDARRGRKLLIIGAGHAGEKAMRESLDNPGLKVRVVGFLDDDKNKQGKAIHGAPILGAIDDIEQIGISYDEILIALPSAKSSEMRHIVSLCEKTGKRFRTMPSIGELINGKISMTASREVTLEDLFGREEIHLDQEKINRYLHDKRILITGAGGSIGTELVRQICRFDPRAVACFDFSEFNLFTIEMECRRLFPHVEIVPFLGDIRDGKTVRRVFGLFRPDVVFHAAAYKHVPMQELNPREAVTVNVMGTGNLVRAARDAGVECFVLVSTDKAVRPSNVMGATKRVAEMLVSDLNRRSGMRFIAVRFGNVLRSSGSVIPMFQEQIARGGPVTVTHPDITRYFMSISEAAQLILQAGAMGEGGEVFILDMGRPVRILDIARDLIRLHGLEPDEDIPIEVIGLRPGEKLYEELITVGEGIVPTGHQKIMVLRGLPSDGDKLRKQVQELLDLTDTFDDAAIKSKLQEIVPEYTPQA